MIGSNKPNMRYRLALDWGSTSLGWAMVRLDAQNETCAVIKAGVRIFSDGRNPKDGSSVAVNVDARDRDKPADFSCLVKTASVLKSLDARKAVVLPMGSLRFVE
jgi:hypothetical protein